MPRGSREPPIPCEFFTWRLFLRQGVYYADGRWLEDQDYAERTICFRLTLVKMVVRQLVRARQLPAGREIELRIHRPRGSDTYCWKVEEVDAMVEFCLDCPDLVWLGRVIVGLAATGLRISELIGLRWSDLDLRHGWIHLTDERASSRRKKLGNARKVKGRRGRKVPIGPSLKEFLERLPRTADGLVFHGRDGTPLKYSLVRETLCQAVIPALQERFPATPGEIGFEHGRLHSFRHFFCSQASLTASEGELKEWLGHRDSEMVARYRHLRDEDAQRRMSQITFFTVDLSAGCSRGKV